MTMSFIQAVTDFGDLGVVLPLSAVLTIVLWRFESGRTATLFAGVLATCLAIMLVLKLAFVSCGAHWNIGVASPSGHASVSMLVYGAFGVVCLTHSTSRLTGVVVAVVVILTMAIAASRVWIGAHNVAEVLIGLGVGATALGAFTAGYRRLPHPPVNLTVLAILAVAGLLLAYGAHAPAEKLVAELGALIRSQSGVCGSTA